MSRLFGLNRTPKSGAREEDVVAALRGLEETLRQVEERLRREPVRAPLADEDRRSLRVSVPEPDPAATLPAPAETGPAPEPEPSPAASAESPDPPHAEPPDAVDRGEAEERPGSDQPAP